MTQIAPIAVAALGALILAAQLLVALGFALFGILVAGTFRPRKRTGMGTVAALPMAPRPG